MKDDSPIHSSGYVIDIQPLSSLVSAYQGDVLLASSSRAKVMYETRQAPTVYFPPEDVKVATVGMSDLQTFCPFKGTASYLNLSIAGETYRGRRH